jgi:alanine dehydrogenase
MIIINEAEARELVSMRDAITAVSGVFRAMARGEARNFPVVREKIEEVNGTFGVKSAVDLASGVVGLKTGGYWPENQARGLKNHQSTTLVCDAATGEARALVAANYLTAIRTAAASAVATDALTRTNVRTLAIIGSGAQALPQIVAQCAVRPFERVLIAARDSSKIEALAKEVERMGLICTYVSAEEAVSAADVVVSVTPSTSPVILSQWVRAGTHLNAVGSDTRGKQELETSLLSRAKIFVDSWQQSSRIGECQRVAAEGIITEAHVSTLGDVLEGTVPGRSSIDEITIFDSTGVSLQDLAVARIAMLRKQHEIR